jgi:hypothetical protein
MTDYFLRERLRLGLIRDLTAMRCPVRIAADMASLPDDFQLVNTKMINALAHCELVVREAEGMSEDEAINANVDLLRAVVRLLEGYRDELLARGCLDEIMPQWAKALEGTM